MKRPLETLTAQEEQVIKLRYDGNWKVVKTLEAIGKIMGYTRQRIEQIEKEALNKLEKTMGKKKPGPIAKPRSQTHSAFISIAVLPEEYEYFKREAGRLNISVAQLIMRPWREQWSKEGKGK